IAFPGGVVGDDARLAIDGGRGRGRRLVEFEVGSSEVGGHAGAEAAKTIFGGVSFREGRRVGAGRVASAVVVGGGAGGAARAQLLTEGADLALERIDLVVLAEDHGAPSSSPRQSASGAPSPIAEARRRVGAGRAVAIGRALPLAPPRRTY